MALANKFKSVRLAAAVLGVLLAGSWRPAAAQTSVFSDEFNGSAINNGEWTWFDGSWFLQRTQFGNAPVIAADGDGTRYARLRLDTYNTDPNQAGTNVRGCEMISRRTFSMGSGLELEARVRAANLPRGLVAAWFTYNERGVWPDSYMKEEIDYELLSNQSRNRLWLNIWNDWNPRYPYNDGAHNADTNPTVSGLDWGQWTVFKIRWLNNRTEWYANNVLVRTDTTILPDDAQNLHFNLWAPSSSWGTAYDAGIVPTANPSNNRSFYVDVDYVRVKTIAPPSGASMGNGTGLTATYFDNTSLTGTSVTRVEPRIYHNWGQFSPAPSIGVDTFSARFVGQVQAQFTQTYTFTTRSDDGVRLWVNGVKLVDNWTNHNPVENSGTIALTAGVKYNITLEYYDNTGSGQIALFWSSSSTTKQPVPQSQLYPADTSGPTVVIQTPVANGGYANPLTARGTASDASGLQSVRARLRRTSGGLYWNGSAWVAAVSDFAVTGSTNWSTLLPTLSAGGHTFQIIARDGVGNTTTTSSIAFSVTSDTVPPAVTITAPGPGFSYRNPFTARGTAADSGGSGVQSIRARVRRSPDGFYFNGSTWGSAVAEINATGTTSWSLTLPTLPNNLYTFSAVARDGAGNTRVTSAVTFHIDGAAPSVTVAAPGSGFSYKSITGASGSASDVGPGVAGVTYRLRRVSNNTYWNGSAWAAAATEVPASGTTTWTVNFPALTDGNYTFQAIARDFAGNAGASAVLAFWVDNVAPVVVVNTPVQNGTYSSLPAASGTATDAGAAVAQVRGRLRRLSDNFYWNGSTWTTSLSEVAASGMATWSRAFPALPAGSYSYQGVGSDYAGNIGTTAVINFTIGNPAPPRSAGALSTGAATVATQSIRLTFNRALDAGSAGDAAHYLAYVAGRPVAIESVAYDAAKRRVTVTLPADSFEAGDDVSVAWSGVGDAGNWHGSSR